MRRASSSAPPLSAPCRIGSAGARSEQGRAMGNNQAMQVGAEAISGLASGALAALLIKLPLAVFAGVAIIGGLCLLRFTRTWVSVGPALQEREGVRA